MGPSPYQSSARRRTYCYPQFLMADNMPLGVLVRANRDGPRGTDTALVSTGKKARQGIVDLAVAAIAERALEMSASIHR